MLDYWLYTQGLISQERLKIEVKLLLSANRKSYLLLRLAQQRMTLSDLEWPFCTISALAWEWFVWLYSDTGLSSLHMCLCMTVELPSSPSLSSSSSQPSSPTQLHTASLSSQHSCFWYFVPYDRYALRHSFCLSMFSVAFDDQLGLWNVRNSLVNSEKQFHEIWEKSSWILEVFASVWSSSGLVLGFWHAFSLGILVTWWRYW